MALNSILLMLQILSRCCRRLSVCTILSIQMLCSSNPILALSFVAKRSLFDFSLNMNPTGWLRDCYSSLQSTQSNKYYLLERRFSGVMLRQSRSLISSTIFAVEHNASNDTSGESPSTCLKTPSYILRNTFHNLGPYFFISVLIY